MQPVGNSYPDFDGIAEFEDWSIKRLAELMDDFISAITERENIDNAELFTQMYTYKLDYSYNETHTISPEMTFQMIYYLVFLEM